MSVNAQQITYGMRGHALVTALESLELSNLTALNLTSASVLKLISGTTRQRHVSSVVQVSLILSELPREQTVRANASQAIHGLRKT